MSTLDAILNPTPDHTIVSWRNFDAPRDLVFQAWTNPEWFKLWWGPKGFKNTFYEFNPTPGGKWRFTMHGPEGGDYENECIFLRVQPSDLIVLHHISEPEFHIVATFEDHDHDGQTHLTFTMVFETPEKRDKLKKIATEGNEQNFDRLEVVLAQMKSEAQGFA